MMVWSVVGTYLISVIYSAFIKTFDNWFHFSHFNFFSYLVLANLLYVNSFDAFIVVTENKEIKSSKAYRKL